MQRSSVDLPEPDAPIKTVAVCSGTVIEISSSTTSLPNALRTFSSANTGMLMQAPGHSVDQ